VRRWSACTARGVWCVIAASGPLLTARRAHAQQVAKRLALVEEARTASGLHRLMWVRVFNDGTIAVDQAQDHSAVFFAPTGRRLKSIGGQGEGIGKFQVVQASGMTGDTLWIFDPYLQRVTFFPPRFQSIKTVRVPWVEVHPVRLYPDGSFVGQLHNKWVRVSASGLVVDSLASHARLRADPYVSLGSSIHFSQSPRGQWAAVVVTPIAAHQPDSVQLSVFSLEKRQAPIVQIRVPFVREVTPAETLARVLRSAKARTGSPEELNAVSAAAPPSFYPPVRHITIDDGRRVWIGLRETNRALKSAYVLIDSVGVPIGTVVFPKETYVMFARGRQVWCEQIDAGFATVIRYRIDVP
jgi:hypothetical protein